MKILILLFVALALNASEKQNNAYVRIKKLEHRLENHVVADMNGIEIALSDQEEDIDFIIGEQGKHSEKIKQMEGEQGKHSEKIKQMGEEIKNLKEIVDILLKTGTKRKRDEHQHKDVESHNLNNADQPNKKIRKTK
jgi:hypothetical protein